MDMNERFKEVWADFDPDATSYIKISVFRKFLFALGEPLGFDKKYQGEKHMQDQFIASLEFPTYHDFSAYQYLDILDALSFKLMVLDHIKKTQMNAPVNATNINSFSLLALQTKDIIPSEAN